MTERRGDASRRGGVSVGPNPTETAAANDTDVSRPLVFDVSKIAGQTNLELMGELFFGSRRVGPGMGTFSPDKLYA